MFKKVKDINYTILSVALIYFFALKPRNQEYVNIFT